MTISFQLFFFICFSSSYDCILAITQRGISQKGHTVMCALFVSVSLNNLSFFPSSGEVIYDSNKEWCEAGQGIAQPEPYVVQAQDKPKQNR